MRIIGVIALFLVSTGVAQGHQQRDLGAHEHGVGTLDIAVEGTDIAMELRAPGADIVGFEHPATTDDDRARIDAAIDTLETPQDVFRWTDAAQCDLVHAEATLLGAEEEHYAHGGHHHKHGHSDHSSAEQHDHGTHTEFHAEYRFSCVDPSQIRQINFGYFALFPNARLLEIQLISDQGSRGFEVSREAPVLDLRDAI